MFIYSCNLNGQGKLVRFLFNSFGIFKVKHDSKIKCMVYKNLSEYILYLVMKGISESEFINKRIKEEL